MCLGRTHALSGAVAGMVAAVALHASRPEVAVAAVLTAGAAVLPDIDHPDATVARSFGFVTRAFAWLVGRLSGGHRHLTHSLFGAGVFTGVAWLGVVYRQTVPGMIGLGVALSLLLASALRAFKLGGHFTDVIAIAAAAGMARTGYGLTFAWYAVAIGCVTHLVGDGLTDEGIPLWAPLSKRHVHLLPEPFAFTTGTVPERVIVVPLLYACAAVIVLQETGLAALLLHVYQHTRR